MNDYPAMISPVNHIEPVPRRIRAYLGGEKVLDTTRAWYVWEWANYPQYYIPLADVRRDLLISEGHTQRTGRGVAERHGLRAGEVHRPRAARLITESAIDGLDGTVRFEWAALDSWFEEDEQVAADVIQRDVVLRVVRPLPDVQGPGGVEHLLGSEVGPDTARHRRDVVHRDDRGGIVVHCVVHWAPIRPG